MPYARPISKHVLLPATLLLLNLFAASARADTVWMENGDRLTGTIRSLDGGILLVSTPYGGDIRITFSQVKTLQSATALIIRDKSVAHEYEAKLLQADKGKVVLNGVRHEEETDSTQTVNTPVPLTTIQGITRPIPLLGGTQFSGKFNLALAQTNSTDITQNYSAALQLQARKGLWRHQLNGSYTRSKDDDVVGTNNYGLDYTLDRFWSEKAFWEGRALHRQDWIEDVRRQTALGTGPGYQFWDDELGAFSLAALAGRVNYGYADGTSDNQFAGSLRWDYTRYFSGKAYEIYTRGELTRPLGGGARVSINGEIGTQYNLTKSFSLYAKYDRNQVSGGRQTINQSIYSTGVGYSW